MGTKTEVITTKKIKESLRAGAHAWPGGYPKAFLTSDGGTLCHACVKENWWHVVREVKQEADSGWRVVAEFVNWEDPNLICDQGNGRIESAYADTDDQEHGCL